MQTLLVLRQRMTGHLVDELLQALLAVLDEVLLENAVVTSERQLSFPALARQRRHDDLTVALQLVTQPLEVAIPSTNARVLKFEDWQIGLGGEESGGRGKWVVRCHDR